MYTYALTQVDRTFTGLQYTYMYMLGETINIMPKNTRIIDVHVRMCQTTVQDIVSTHVLHLLYTW